MKRHEAYIGLGTNTGDRKGNLAAAAAALAQDSRITVIRESSLYETSPVGNPDQPDFLNMVVLVETDVEAPELLRVLLSIEDRMGRVRQERWGPRVIDLDLLLFDQLEICREDLQVPHPRLGERAFVLIPLLEITPGLKLPDGTSLESLLAGIDPDRQKVKKISQPDTIGF